MFFGFWVLGGGVFCFVLRRSQKDVLGYFNKGQKIFDDLNKYRKLGKKNLIPNDNKNVQTKK